MGKSVMQNSESRNEGNIWASRSGVGTLLSSVFKFVYDCSTLGVPIKCITCPITNSALVIKNSFLQSELAASAGLIFQCIELSRVRCQVDTPPAAGVSLTFSPISSNFFSWKL